MRCPAASPGGIGQRLGDVVSLQIRILAKNLLARPPGGNYPTLSQAQITELIYMHDVGALRDTIVRYLKTKAELWLLFDNLDKGWATQGLSHDDVLIIRSLLEATRKLERDLNRHDITAHSVVFLRNDVYEILVEETPDRGKESKVFLGWTDPDLLRELLRRRLVFTTISTRSTTACTC